MRKSSLTDTSVAISREVQSEYDNIKLVAENINAVKQVASADLGQLGADITGLEAGIQVIEDKIAAGGLTGPRGLKGDTGAVGPQGIQGVQGPQGIIGVRGFTVRPTINAVYNPATGDIDLTFDEVLYNEEQIITTVNAVQPREV